MRDDDETELGWAEQPENRRRIRWLLYAICGALLALEGVIYRHATHSLEQTPAFYAFYGFAALIFAVLAAKGLRRLVRRSEDYYDHSDGQ